MPAFCSRDLSAGSYVLYLPDGTYLVERLPIHVAASATVGLWGREGSTLRKTVLPTLYYLLVIGVLGLLAVHVLGVADPLMTGGPPGP